MAASSESFARGSATTVARLLGVASSLFALALAALLALGISDLAHHRFAQGLGLVAAVLALRWALSSGLEEWGASCAAHLRARWRRALVGHFELPRPEGERARGDLALAVDDAAEAPALERLRASAASSLAGVVVIFWAAGWLAFLITVALLGVAAPLYQRAGRRSEQMAAQYRGRRAVLEARQLEVLQHAPELRALGAVTYGADEIAAISESEHAIALRAIRVALESSLVTEFLSGVSIGLVAMVVGFGLLEGHLSLVRALTAVLVASELFVQVRRYGVEFHRRDDAEVARRSLEALDHEGAAAAEGELLEARRVVTSAHPEPVTFDVRPGDRVIITGPSGAGKTTLLYTLLQWRPALAGSSRRADVPIGFVSAESALLSGSLRENLTLGSTFEDRELFDRLDSLGLSGRRFEDLDAELLSDGRGMSSGERVRVVLARAILAGAQLLVLDDVAGLLDAEARESVRRAISELELVAVIEATVDTPLLERATTRIGLRA